MKNQNQIPKTVMVADLPGHIGPTPEGVDPALHLIAETPPRTLTHAVNNTYSAFNGAERKVRSVGYEQKVASSQRYAERTAADEASMRLDWQRLAEETGTKIQDSQRSGNTALADELLDMVVTERENARSHKSEGLRKDTQQAKEEAAALKPLHEAAKVKVAELAPQRKLSKEVNELQHTLSRPARYLAALACAAALGLSSGGLVNQQVKKHNAIYAAQTGNPNTNDSRVDETVLAGGIGAGSGAVVGYMLGGALTGRAARRRAKKIIRKQQAKQSK